MKKLIIISTLLLLNCADNITNTTYNSNEAKVYCTVNEWNNGDIKEIYGAIQDSSYSEYTKFYEISIDSVKGDSSFYSTLDSKIVIVDRRYSDIDKLLKYDDWYEAELQYYGYANMYIEYGDVYICSE